MKSGHPYKLNKVVDGKPPEYAFSEVPNPPEGYTWADITYAIGGHGWKARFFGKDGYVITGGENATTQCNLFNERLGLGDIWVAYHAGEQKPYSCGPLPQHRLPGRGTSGWPGGHGRHLGVGRHPVRGMPWSGKQP
jgi:hypothetical protein